MNPIDNTPMNHTPRTYVLRNTGTGQYVTNRDAGHGAPLFVCDIAQAAKFENWKNANWLAQSLSRNGHACEAQTIHLNIQGKA